MSAEEEKFFESWQSSREIWSRSFAVDDLMQGLIRLRSLTLFAFVSEIGDLMELAAFFLEE